MKRLFFLFAAVITFTFLGSCSLDDNSNFHFQALQIVSAELPDSFTLNETYQIQVTYTRPDRCANFEGFDVTKPELTTRDVVVMGTVRTDLDCTGGTTEETATFNFVVLYDEPYVFRFWQGEGSDGEQQFLEIQVPVN